VLDVDSYSHFLKFMTTSKVHHQTKYEKEEQGKIVGGFEADTSIGFQLVNFNYVSKITYENPALPIYSKLLGQKWMVSTVSPSTSVFKSLESKWLISNSSSDGCRVDYSIQMEFASPLFAAVTRQFFDLLATGQQEQFEKRTLEVGHIYAQEIIDSSQHESTRPQRDQSQTK
jgi:ribosome-associated toxin RatA of RatAB toxin-antitoxin module